MLGWIADQMDMHLGLPDPAAARAEIGRLGIWTGSRTTAPDLPVRPAAWPRPGQAVLATWHRLLDPGRMQDGELYLAGTARPAVARMSPATAAGAGAADGGTVAVATAHGSVTAPVQTADMPDRVVWLPANSAGCQARRQLGAGHGSLVRLSGASTR